MKRNRFSLRETRKSKAKNRRSHYAQKLESGQMMYGPGCCAHSVVITEADRREMRRLREANDRPRALGSYWEPQ